MRVYQLDPIEDPRWAELVSRHPKASVFQSVGWLHALQRTYGYKPAAFTTCSPISDLQNGLVLCHVRSWLTGGRMVSLPFSDHCEPLFDSKAELRFTMEYLQADLQRRGWKYIEVRPVNGSFSQTVEEIDFRPATRYSLHRVDLRPNLGQIFQSLDKNSVQRRIHRAERAGVTYERGTTPKLLDDFYKLLLLTRRRHHLLPQPYLWFRNLVDCMKDAFQIRLAYDAQRPIAAIATLQFRNVVYYKYGCSDAKFKHLGAMPFLLWKAIEESKMTGAREFDLGRSDTDDKGLIEFKNHWAQAPTEVTYWRYPTLNTSGFEEARKWSIVRRVFASMPSRLFAATGRLVYRHMG